MGDKLCAQNDNSCIQRHDNVWCSYECCWFVLNCGATGQKLIMYVECCLPQLCLFHAYYFISITMRCVLLSSWRTVGVVL